MFTPHEKASALSQLEKAWEVINQMPTTTPCNLCKQFNAGNCRYWNQVVPPEAIPAGCENFDFNSDSAPF